MAHIKTNNKGRKRKEGRKEELHSVRGLVGKKRISKCEVGHQGYGIVRIHNIHTRVKVSQ